MTLQCVLWTSVSHYALNVKNVMTDILYQSFM